MINKDGTDFVRADSGQRFRIWGVNYDHQDGSGKLLEEYWHEQWPTIVEDFDEIKQLGANVVRIHLQIGAFVDSPTKANAENLHKLTELVHMAESKGLYLDITGLGCYHDEDVPGWYDALDEAQRWEVQAFFWERVAETCAGSPAIFCYDLMNEPILPGPNKKETGWLAGEFGGKHFVQRISLDLDGRSRQEVARAWVDRLVAAIRQHDETTLVTVGVIPWALTFPGAKPIFYSDNVGAKLDFVSVHFYPRQDEVDKAITALRVYEVGKPLVVEETFPLRCGIDELEAFMSQAGDDVDGWISFYWGKTANEYARENTVAAGIKRAWLKRFQELAPTFRE